MPRQVLLVTTVYSASLANCNERTLQSAAHKDFPQAQSTRASNHGVNCELRNRGRGPWAHRVSAAQFGSLNNLELYALVAPYVAEETFTCKQDSNCSGPSPMPAINKQHWVPRPLSRLCPCNALTTRAYQHWRSISLKWACY